jgi:hypothetical protein
LTPFLIRDAVLQLLEYVPTGNHRRTDREDRDGIVDEPTAAQPPATRGNGLAFGRVVPVIRDSHAAVPDGRQRRQELTAVLVLVVLVARTKLVGLFLRKRQHCLYVARAVFSFTNFVILWVVFLGGGGAKCGFPDAQHFV